MPGPLVVPIALGVGQILGNLFGNLFGASKQASAARQATDAQARATQYAADLERQSIREALEYQKQLDERDYGNWLQREARDRKDWEAAEQRRAPYRALGDSAVRTLADYIRVPGMHPAQEVPVQTWTHQGQMPAPMTPYGPQPTSNTMPVGGGYQRMPDMSMRAPQRRTLRDFAY